MEGYFERTQWASNLSIQFGYRDSLRTRYYFAEFEQINAEAFS